MTEILFCVTSVTYIQKSKKDNSYYYGSTENLAKRLYENNNRKVKYTKGHLPWVIHYFEEFENRSEEESLPLSITVTL